MQPVLDRHNITIAAKLHSIRRMIGLQPHVAQRER
jgi:hypothetical protein